VNEDAPIELYGFHPEHEHLILARRAGEPSFVWVQDLGEAYQAAAARGVDVVVTREFRDELLARGASPLEVRGLRVL
jgi:hypothetical protein